MPKEDLSPYFDEPILKQEYLDPGYEDHATDVIKVTTQKGVYIYRSPRYMNDPSGLFGLGVYHLFGLDMRDIFMLEELNQQLMNIGQVSVPKVLKKGKTNKGNPYIIVEFIKGKNLGYLGFKGVSLTILKSLGEIMARIHSRAYPFYGQAIGETKYSLETFHQRMFETIDLLLKKYPPTNPEIEEYKKSIDIGNIPLPIKSSLVMIDMDARQFFTNESVVSAIIDTDAYVIAPPELDLIALEYTMDEEGANAFKEGYGSILQFPRLDKARPLYRYFYRVIESQGETNFSEWMNYPYLF